MCAQSMGERAHGSSYFFLICFSAFLYSVVSVHHTCKFLLFGVLFPSDYVLFSPCVRSFTLYIAAPQDVHKNSLYGESVAFFV